MNKQRTYFDAVGRQMALIEELTGKDLPKGFQELVNEVKGEMLEDECICRKCGTKLDCRFIHEDGEEHQESLCARCSN